MFHLLLIRLVLTLLLEPLLLETILQNILSIEKHYSPILNLLELLSITELSMKPGSYHTKKFNKGLNLMILIQSCACINADPIFLNVLTVDGALWQIPAPRIPHPYGHSS